LQRLVYNIPMKMRNELKIFDIDETLFETTAKIRILKEGRVVKQLTNTEYNTYVLGDDEVIDFTEFKDAEKFFSESKPIHNLLEMVKESLENGHDVKIVTARADFDDRDKFLETFRTYFDIDRVHVYRAGNMDNRLPAAVKKAKIITECLNRTKYSKVSLFDDCMANLEEFLNLKDVFKNVEFDALFVEDGRVSKVI